MINKRFSIHDAYSFGVKSVTNHFGFFFVTMLLGAGAAALFLSLLGYVDYMMFKEHFESMINVLSSVMRDPMGLARVAGTNVHEAVRAHLPASLAQHVSPQEVLTVDITRENVMEMVKFALPVLLGLKLVVELLSIGWTKIALDLQANKPVEYDYLYKFYALVPRVLAVEIIKGIATMIGIFLFIVPGIFVYQRLRFAKYFVIDKNQSIMQALESSWRLTDSSVVHLLGYSLFAAFVMALGRFFFPLMFFVLPLGFQVDANIYRQMAK